MALVEFQGVAKHYGELQALRGIDLSIEQGEVFGLIGPNGSGKTTSLLLLCGLIRPTEGRVTVAGVDVAKDPLSARRKLCFVPDGAPLYANLSPRRHISLVGRLHGLDEDHIGKEGPRLLRELDLESRIDDPVGQFSRGMRQKLALACAILPRPELLVLDEPLSGLDAPTTAVIKEVLRAWAQRGHSVLYTSHLLDVVERVCDRIAILDDGKLVGQGSLQELREQTGTGGDLQSLFQQITQSEDPSVRAERLLG